jgi:NAD(P)-dependent dehydrogenase (short-subunit alcohol dehydrogenase family)
LSTPQTPISSGFSATSTAEDVIRGIDLTGKTAIVTGGYSGLGRETVRVFREAGASVIVPARDVERATAALKDISGVEVWSMDLLDPASIDAFAERFLALGQPLHMLVTNAGIMALPTRTLDARGHEQQFATNHLGHFQLTRRLWPALVQAQGARVVALSSRGHRFSPVVFEDIDFEHRPYDPWTSYGQSKTANVLFAIELDARGQKDNVRAFAVHPGGIVDTGLAKNLAVADLQAVGAVNAEGEAVIAPEKGLKNVPQGASTQVWCATSPQLNGLGGVYCEDTDIAPLEGERNGDDLNIGNLSRAGVLPYAIDRAAAARLWALSEEWLGLKS